MYFIWWRDQESNQGHGDFQSPALPTELSRQPNHNTRLALFGCQHDFQKILYLS
jgi:hypothetical protein